MFKNFGIAKRIRFKILNMETAYIKRNKFSAHTVMNGFAGINVKLTIGEQML